METTQKKAPVFTLNLVESGVAKPGERSDEVVIGVGPAFCYGGNHLILPGISRNKWE
ncbi:glycerol dehydratase 21 kDa subunit [Shimwellia blattae DSM 4481 = NBRC 105725]|uniref:Glycerol dehydratase 21 kDa subunit n=2 Tax=Shimwellia blattae TaxID=563 RepID=I2BC33_SHIBC|nr:glycerol dehydratase 21 kDa subunit [Shimwellia blattae DSM 4481 = NBRC 105725]AFJ48087.1 glycerol dehydratase 21 kDa subunit [Shimwellia blattae DSM 4481 = NBRC 105725]GAB81925.1 glycerol dehydratase subunit [Shimwellia blattae DSM 4481 = NBRC 105725]VDY65585.1 propanediol dehydratase medium subunit [Shimwellia blattae]VEC25024.1 propanediol dehydratase medium subunit [Shimwellia blattae]